MPTAAEHDAPTCKPIGKRVWLSIEALKDRPWTAACRTDRQIQKAAASDYPRHRRDNSRQRSSQAQDVLDDTHAFDAARWDGWVQKAEAARFRRPFIYAVRRRLADVEGLLRHQPNNRTGGRRPVRIWFAGSSRWTIDSTRSTVSSEKPEWGSDKGTARKAIAERFRILMLVGDDLGDFLSEVRQSPENRRKLVEKYAKLLGANDGSSCRTPMYRKLGSGAVWRSDNSLSPSVSGSPQSGAASRESNNFGNASWLTKFRHPYIASEARPSRRSASPRPG
jgi:acid phosphatase